MAVTVRNFLVIAAAMLVVTACATIPRTAYTYDDMVNAQVYGYEDIRFFADAPLDEFRSERFAGSLPVTIGTNNRLQMLALSGGGSAGAFGAGILVGWTENGNRPVFDLVTGVSAGALIAPFAFLGSSEDAKLRELFTSGIAEELFKPFSPLKGLLGESILDGRPLSKLVAQYVDRDFLRRIAQAHQSGRRLWVVTSNLDSQRSVVWNMGAIAASRNPDAIALFRQVLVASASIPAAFPAVRISAMSNGKRFEELHSDGGVTRQIFVVPDALLAANTSATGSGSEPRDVYLIINNEYDPQFEVVKSRSVSVAARAYSTLIKTTTQSTINASYAFSQRNGINFNMTYIDRYIPYKASDPFNTKYMQQLFRLGESRWNHKVWDKSPPLGRTLVAEPDTASALPETSLSCGTVDRRSSRLPATSPQYNAECLTPVVQ